MILIKYMLNQDGRTPLYKACEEGHNEVIKILLKAGANVNKYMKVSNIQYTFNDNKLYIFI